MRAAALIGIGDGLCANGLLRPTGAAQLLLCARNVEIGDGNDMEPAREARLGKEHGAELSGANQTDGHRPARNFALEQHGMETHARSFV
jgi:hypothetical protein